MAFFENIEIQNLFCAEEADTFPPFTEEDLAETEKAIGWKLPASYLALLNIQNGGRIDDAYEDSWLSVIYGISSIGVYRMSRIESEELSMMDIEWYGVDRKGKIAVFCSAGVANVPEFVCADKERQERLIALFEKLPILSGVSFCFACAEKNLLPFQVAETFSGKGLFYYDSDDHSKSQENIGVCQKYYTISSKPTNPLFYAELPASIQLLLKDNFLPIDDFQTCSIVAVENAY